MPAFAPGCRHDVFVSYAHVDDQPAAGIERGWVDTLVSNLRTLLGQKLGRSDAFSLWIDDQLARNKPITPEILGHLENSATLLLILSPGYVASEWCQREKNRFIEAVATRVAGNTRTFVVERERLDSDQRQQVPELAELVGYRLWVDQGEGRPSRTLGFPAPNPLEAEYYNLLNDIAHDLAAELKQLKEADSRQANPAGANGSGVVNGAGSNGNGPVDSSAPTVFLAEVTDDIDDLRNSTRRHLLQAGVQVLPDAFYPRGPVEFQAAMERDLPSCRLFVQLLSRPGGKKTLDLPQGYAGLQHELALGAGLPIVQWRSCELDLSKVEDQDHQRLLNGPTVMATGLEELKQTVTAQALAPRPGDKPPTQAFIFVDTEQGDRPLAEHLCGLLDRHGIGYALPLSSGSAAEIRQDLESNLIGCDALIIVYGSTPATWARQQLQSLRKVVQNREEPLRGLAIYDGPPVEKVPLDYKLPDMRLLNCREGIDEASLVEFLTGLEQGAP